MSVSLRVRHVTKEFVNDPATRAGAMPSRKHTVPVALVRVGTAIEEDAHDTNFTPGGCCVKCAKAFVIPGRKISAAIKPVMDIADIPGTGGLAKLLDEFPRLGEGLEGRRDDRGGKNLAASDIQGTGTANNRSQCALGD